MARIRLLPDAVINRIAAGEVVERPASVVKELVENSLDAGAKAIAVHLREGGVRSVEVSDDGCGMDPEDALLALERHATSKLTADSQLDAITTLGFRGEALPSIAAVAHLVLETAAVPGEGTRVVCDFGRIRDVRPFARPVGTRIEVSDLFQHLPARRKFLRSRETELRHAVTLLTTLALSRPTVSFLLLHNCRTVLQLPPARGLFSRLPDLLGPRRAAAVIPVNHERGEAGVSGFLLPTPNPHPITLAVNGRAVRDRLLSAVAHRAIRNTPGSLAVEGFVSLQIPVHLVDVNVHPAKAEVRFADPSGVAALLTAALAGALARLRGPREIRRLGTVPTTPSSQAALFLSYPPALPAPMASEPSPSPEPAPPTPTPFGQLLGQYRGTYLIIEDSDGLLLIDQHVAHERVLYDELLARDTNTPVQPLLIPLVVELRPEYAALAAELAGELATLGLELEPLSGTSVRIVAAPPGFPSTALEDMLPALLADLESGAAPGDTLRQRAAAALACRAAIKKNAPIARPQAEHLLARLASSSDPHRCPHGRPIALRLPHAEIERRIGRV